MFLFGQCNQTEIFICINLHQWFSNFFWHAPFGLKKLHTHSTINSYGKQLIKKDPSYISEKIKVSMIALANSSFRDTNHFQLSFTPYFPSDYPCLPWLYANFMGTLWKPLKYPIPSDIRRPYFREHCFSALLWKTRGRVKHGEPNGWWLKGLIKIQFAGVMVPTVQIFKLQGNLIDTERVIRRG